jgi:phosphoribosylamine-glycine ligase
MRFAIYSHYACDLPFAARLQDEGHEVLVHTAYDKKGTVDRDAGRGLVPQDNNLASWTAWGSAGTGPSIYLFTGTGNGKIADRLRRAGKLVLGGGSFPEKLEGKRAWAEAEVRKLGITVPPHQEFPDIPSARAYAKHIDGEWVFKSDRYLKASATYLASGPEDMVRYLDKLHSDFGMGGKCLLQRKIPGTALSTAAWFNGSVFLRPFEGTIEHKRFLNNDLGPNTGCSFNVVWLYEDEPRIAEALCWNNLETFFRDNEAPPGLYDINALIGKDGTAYFLEFTPRFGYDSEPTAQQLLPTELGEFYYKLVTGRLSESPFVPGKLAYAVRLSIPPYPTELDIPRGTRDMAHDTHILGADGLWDGNFIGYGVKSEGDDLVVSDRMGLVGLACATNVTLKDAHDEVMNYLKKDLEVPNLQYRTDGVERIEEDRDALAKTSFGIKELE